MTFLPSARLIVEDEASAAGQGTSEVAAVERAYLKVAGLFAPVIGRGGFDALFAKSLAKAASTSPPLFPPDDLSAPIERAVRELSGQPPAVVRERGAAVLGTFLTELSTFIGEALVRQLLRNRWPNLDPSSATDRLEKK